MKRKLGHIVCAAACGLATVSAAWSQGSPGGAVVGSPAPVNSSSAATARRAPGSMLDQAASPAALELVGGKLTIHATNSSLRAILAELQTRTGTQVEGLNRDERIFGVYGPGEPQAVLAALLDDSGYNVLIAGRRPDGAPRQIVLSQRTTVAAAQNAPRTQAAEEEDDSSDTPEPQQAPPPPPQAPAAPAANPGIKTPQQMLEELQRLRQNALGQTPPQ